MFVNYYEELGVSPDASIAEINAKYRELALKFHPDKSDIQTSSEQKKEFIEKFKVISIGVQVLRCAKARKKFDQELLSNTHTHSYFDDFIDESSQSYPKSPYYNRESAEEEYYYCLLMASKFDKSLLDKVAVSSNPTGPEIRAMKKYIQDVEAARLIRERGRKEVDDSLNKLIKERRELKKKPKNTRQKQTKSTKHQTDSDVNIPSESSQITEMPTQNDYNTQQSTSKDMNISDKTSICDIISQHHIARQDENNLSEDNSSQKNCDNKKCDDEYLEAINLALSRETSPESSHEIPVKTGVKTNSDMCCEYNTPLLTKASQTTLSLISIPAQYSGILEELFKSISKDNNPANNEVSATSKGEKLCSNTHDTNNKAGPNSYHDTSIKRKRQVSTVSKAKAIKVQAQTMLVSNAATKELELKYDFVGSKDWQKEYVLKYPLMENIRKYCPIGKDANKYSFSYWVYANGESINSQEQKDITDMHIYLSDKKHTCKLVNKHHNYKNTVSSPFKRTVELHIQPGLFTFVCAHCGKQFNAVTNCSNHLKTHILDVSRVE